MTSEKQIKGAMQEVLKLASWRDDNGNLVVFSQDMAVKECVDFLKKTIPHLTSEDFVSPEAAVVLAELGWVNPVQEVVDNPVLEERTIHDEIADADLKGLKTICQSEPQFKSIRGKLASYKDEDKLREQMLWLMQDHTEEKVEEKIQIKDIPPTFDTAEFEKQIKEPPLGQMIEDEEQIEEPPSVEELQKLIDEQPIVKMAREIAVSDVITKDPFKSLFVVNSQTLNSIIANMVQDGFDPAYPVILWDNVMIDGHTRLKAAKESGITSIPFLSKEFRDEQEALEYAMHNQRDRRNASEAELLNAISLLDKPKTKAEAGATRGSEGTSSKKTAQILGIKESKVANARAVLKDEEAIKLVKGGKTSINKAAIELRKIKAEEKKKEKAEKKAIEEPLNRIDAILQVMKDHAGESILQVLLIEESDNKYLEFGGESNMTECEFLLGLVVKVLKNLGYVKLKDKEIVIKKSLK